MKKEKKLMESTSSRKKLSFEGLSCHINLITEKLVFLCLLFLLTGCSYYKYTTKQNQPPADFLTNVTQEAYPKLYESGEIDSYTRDSLALKLFDERVFYLVNKEGKWLLHNAKLSGDTLIAKAVFVPYPEEGPKAPEMRKIKRYFPKTEKYIIHSVFLYSDSLQLNEQGLSYIPLSSINHFNVYKKNRAMKVGIAAPFFLVLAFFIAALIAMANFSFPY